jgi:hypothetical protein
MIYQMGSGANGANLVGFGDFRDRLAPAHSGNGFEDEGLGDFPHFPDDLLQTPVSRTRNIGPVAKL